MDMITLLLVEDDANDARLVQERLADMQVEWVRTAAEAFDRLTGIDLVLLDLGLPDSEGFDTVTHMLEAAPQVPIVVLTGTDDATLRQLALEAGAQEYVLKDAMGELPSRVDAALTRQRHRNRALAQALTAGIRGAAFADQTPMEPPAPVAAAEMGTARLRAALPELFARLTDSYASLLQQALESRAYSDKGRPLGEARALTREVGLLNGSPRDLVDIHLAALDALSHRAHPERLSALADEGRVLLLEVIGYLAMHYRDHAPLRQLRQN